MPFVLFVLQEQRKDFVRSFGRHVVVNAGILVGIKTLDHSSRITAFFGKDTLSRLQDDNILGNIFEESKIKHGPLAELFKQQTKEEGYNDQVVVPVSFSLCEMMPE